MDVTATSSATSAYGSASTGSGSSPGGTDFNTFLRMLTVQMQNQDPLNPIDSTDYAVQLATFSGSNSRRKPISCLKPWPANFR